MAGNYPDVPAPRMSYDRDGTTVFRINSDNSVTVLSGAQAQALNDHTGSGVSVNAGGTWSVYYGVVFPQLRNVAGFIIAGSNSGDYRTNLLQTSPDTTNGIDGTWTTQITTPSIITTAVTPEYRSNITAVAYANIRGVRFRAQKVLGAASGTHTVNGFHLYGSIADYTGMDTLRLWHPTLDEPLDDNSTSDGAFFDWGDVPRGSTQDRTFRIKNNSATLTANTVQVTQQALTDTTPSVVAMYTFSDGGAFAANIDIGNLAPGAISPVITKRFTVPTNAVLSLWTSRTVATPTSWS